MRRKAFLLLFLALIALAFCPACMKARRDFVSKNMQTGREVVKVCKVYAEEHQGWPPSLQAMVPEIITQEEYDHLRFYDPKSKKNEEWIYTPPDAYPAKELLELFIRTNRQHHSPLADQ